ncbi:MAG: Ig-like domain repeat protein [Anaerolineales bacterium]|nr:Ig-like domain repeat protein [Anaerolineales bacterium]
MNQQNEKEPHSSRLLLFLILLSVGVCLLYVWATQSIRPLYDLSRDESIPYSINATKTADYSPDFHAPVGNVSLSIILDLFQDLDPASVPESRMATLVGSLQTPVSSVTAPAGSTQTDSTAQATSVVETTIPETALTENLVVIPNTPIPSTSTAVPPPPPPPPPKPTKPPEEEPPTPVPPTPIPPATPEPALLEIINPSSDGATLTANDDTTFEAKAWDPAVGTNNGDGITSVTFRLYDSIGNTIHTYIDTASSYCAFGGNNNCSDAASAGILLSSDTYTLEATMLTNAGETKTLTRAFVIPALTQLNIIVPPADGTSITNMNDTRFEAEAWDPAIGIMNGDGITSVTFTIYDSIGNIVHTYTDITSLYCAFGGDSACAPSVAAGITLPADTYTLEATVLTNAGGTETVTRTFIIP